MGGKVRNGGREANEGRRKARKRMEDGLLGGSNNILYHINLRNGRERGMGGKGGKRGEAEK